MRNKEPHIDYHKFALLLQYILHTNNNYWWIIHIIFFPSPPSSHTFAYMPFSKRLGCGASVVLVNPQINHQSLITWSSSRYIVYTTKRVSKDHRHSLFVPMKVTGEAAYGRHTLRISPRLLVFLAGVLHSFSLPSRQILDLASKKTMAVSFQVFGYSLFMVVLQFCSTFSS
jgi:hypothetical protein